MGNHGTTSGSINTPAAGRFGRAGQFDGSGWIAVQDDPSLHATSELTVAAWVYSERIEAGYWPGYVTKRVGYADQTAFSLLQGQEGYVTVDVGNESDRFRAETPLSYSTWTHVAFVYNGGWTESERVRLFLDGKLDRVASESESTLPASTAPLAVGNLPNGGNLFEGRLDEVAVWNRALRGAEIAAVAAGALSP